ncbi:unnamed protein product [Blepharisma stoltei]|uniref:Uncharacterized protein n=1 Tax=Blepharisma stoltei TaxID=1481888 RepID=A0AAU9KBF2_9CILI|nr:unnamed protein product [Blepharisma stoltei]
MDSDEDSLFWDKEFWQEVDGFLDASLEDRYEIMIRTWQRFFEVWIRRLVIIKLIDGGEVLSDSRESEYGANWIFSRKLKPKGQRGEKAGTGAGSESESERGAGNGTEEAGTEAEFEELKRKFKQKLN